MSEETGKGEVVKGDYVLATKYSDGDPKDQFSVAFFDRKDGDRFMLVDSLGKCQRANGFRRCEKISDECGHQIVKDMKEIEMGDVSLWEIKRRHEDGEVEEFKDDADFLAKVRDTDATPEDVERFHSIIERLTLKAALCERMAEALRQAKEGMDTWLACYCPEGVGVDHTIKAQRKILEEGPGTIGYIANKTKMFVDLLSEFDREAKK